MKDLGFAAGFFTGVALALSAFLILAAIAEGQQPNRISPDAARSGWGQSDGRVYRVTPVEVVPPQEPRL